jgi:hypothetical protein
MAILQLSVYPFTQRLFLQVFRYEYQHVHLAFGQPGYEATTVLRSLYSASPVKKSNSAIEAFL